MSNDFELDATSLSPELARAGTAMFFHATHCGDQQAFLDAAVACVQYALHCEACVVRAERGHYRVLAATSPTLAPPDDLLADVLDQQTAAEQGDWSVALISEKKTVLDLLCLQGSTLAAAKMTVTLLASATHTARKRLARVHRIARLEAILEIAASWNQTLEMDELLVQMAETSTQLLQAERASIFLWDRGTRTLVGRPALGVDGDELRIPQDTGIVGHVVQTGETRRVDTEEDQREIDRRVDQQLSFQTRNLLCVPLRGRNEKILGAFEMINKIHGNFTAEDESALVELAAHAAVALENTQQREHLLQSRNQMADHAAAGIELIGSCPALESLKSKVRRVANTDLAVLVLGENGTGKEVVSQMIHYHSERRNELLVAVNCAALTETLLESELFGHEKGAFTDAHETRAGKFELAAGGTIFLDEIGDMSLGGQAKLLRVLEEKVVVRVGGTQTIATDARVIAATNQDLAELVRNKQFREDLYFRLNVVTLELPPLRERGDDIVTLAEHFLAPFAAKARRVPPTFSAAAKKRLRGHTWPGNVRELRNMMERLAYLAPSDRVDEEDLDFIISPSGEQPQALSLELPLNDATRRFQAEYIKRQIARAGGNMTETAKHLGLHRSNLYRKMRQLDMETDEESA